MSEHQEGLLTDVASAIGTTLGRVANTTTELVRTAQRKATAQMKRRGRKSYRRRKLGVRATAVAAGKGSSRARRSARRKSAATNTHGTRKTRRTLRPA
jgi:hypothetical protein